MEGYGSMSITSPGPCTLPKENKKIFAVKNTNDVSDIDGAKPAIRYKVYNDKPNFLDTSDIAGAQSKVLIRGRNTRDNSLYIDDIEGTRRTIKDRMMRTGRHVDPLQPHYPLPSYAPMEPVQTKFIKDPLEIRDIEGTHPRPKKEFATRDIMSINDIDGAAPGLKHDKILQASKTRDILACNDISAKTHRYTDKTHRVTDPNNPSYRINGMEIYDDRYTKPKPSRKYVPNFSLETKDITGAQADSRYADPFPRREFRNTNYIGDIEGSHADSIRPGIKTNRQTHPLQPVYQSLDPGELLLPLIPPLIPPEMVKVPTLPAVHSTKNLSRPKTDPDLMSTTWGNTGEFTMAAAQTNNNFGKKLYVAVFNFNILPKTTFYRRFGPSPLWKYRQQSNSE